MNLKRGLCKRMQANLSIGKCYIANNKKSFSYAPAIGNTTCSFIVVVVRQKIIVCNRRYFLFLNTQYSLKIAFFTYHCFVGKFLQQFDESDHDTYHGLTTASTLSSQFFTFHFPLESSNKQTYKVQFATSMSF